MARHHYTCSNCGAPFIVIATGGVIAEGAKDAAHRFVLHRLCDGSLVKL